MTTLNLVILRSESAFVNLDFLAKIVIAHVMMDSMANIANKLAIVPSHSSVMQSPEHVFTTAQLVKQEKTVTKLVPGVHMVCIVNLSVTVEEVSVTRRTDSVCVRQGNEANTVNIIVTKEVGVLIVSTNVAV